ncbi:MAG: DUF3667 domain-containing protein [Acidobacteriota bacterium]
MHADDEALEHQPESTSSEDGLICRNCGRPRQERFCGACGQDHRYERLETRALLKDGIDAFLNLDGTFWTTFRGLLRHPGKLATAYVSGQRRCYTHPIRYLLIAVAFYAILLSLAGKKPSDLSTDVYGEGSLAAESMKDHQDDFNAMFQWMLLTAIPAVAFGLRMFFLGWLSWWPRSAWNWNFAEGLVLMAFIQSQGIFVITPVFFFLDQHFGIAFSWALVPSLIYYTWAVRDFYRCRWWLAAVAYVSAYILWMGGIALVGGLIGGLVAVGGKVLGG